MVRGAIRRTPCASVGLPAGNRARGAGWFCRAPHRASRSREGPARRSRRSHEPAAPSPAPAAAGRTSPSTRSETRSSTHSPERSGGDDAEALVVAVDVVVGVDRRKQSTRSTLFHERTALRVAQEGLLGRPRSRPEREARFAIPRRRVSILRQTAADAWFFGLVSGQMSPASSRATAVGAVVSGRAAMRPSFRSGSGALVPTHGPWLAGTWRSSITVLIKSRRPAFAWSYAAPERRFRRPAISAAVGWRGKICHRGTAAAPRGCCGRDRDRGAARRVSAGVARRSRGPRRGRAAARRVTPAAARRSRGPRRDREAARRPIVLDARRVLRFAGRAPVDRSRCATEGSPGLRVGLSSLSFSCSA